MLPKCWDINKRLYVGQVHPERNIVNTLMYFFLKNLTPMLIKWLINKADLFMKTNSVC